MKATPKANETDFGWRWNSVSREMSDRMKKFWVETYRPHFPESGIKLRVHSKEPHRDRLHPCMTALMCVLAATRQDVVPKVAEAAALALRTGHNNFISLVMEGS